MNLDLMRLIDKQLLETPFYGVRQMTWHLRNDGHLVNEKRIRRLMRLMGLMPIYQKPNNSKAAKGHKIYPYLLRGLRVGRPNQVWCADITYLPMQRGFLYLVAIMDWHTRKVLSWRISNTLEAEFCVDALNEAIHKFGPPEIMNTDHGSQFTSFAWTDRLRRTAVRISMDGKGRFLDNIFFERLWRSLKYECVYLHAWETGSEAKAGVRKWVDFYNHKRPHSALGGKSPAVIYWQRMAETKPDQQVQEVALFTPDTVQRLGNSSDNTLDRQFEIDAPDRIWVTDITYIRTHEGWSYLAVVIDLFSRCVGGWSPTES